MRRLIGALQDMDSWSGSWHVPSTSAITQARRRLGPEPPRRLFENVAVPVAGPDTKGAWLAGRRLMATDGFSLDIADTAENVAFFGKRSSGPKAGAFPQAVIVGLGECGSHAIVGASLAGVATGERALAVELVGCLEPDMLVLADRNFHSFPLSRAFRDTGADLLWRVSASVSLPVVHALPDGSYQSMLINPEVSRSRRAGLLAAARAGRVLDPDEAVAVRVVDYQIANRTGNGTGELMCLITSIGDPHDTSAVELAAAYHERWEFEGLIDEVKTHQRGPARVLRSKSPAMVEQEIWAYLLTHYAVRTLMCRAADEADVDVDVDRLSFIRSLRVIRRQVTDQADFPPSAPSVP